MNLLTVPYLGESLSLLTAVVWAFAVILFKRSGETVHPIGLNVFKNLLAAALFVPTFWLVGEELFRPAPIGDYLLLLLSGALGIGIADTLFFKCLNLLGAGLTAIVDCLYSPFVIGLSLLFLGESLSLWQLVGATLIISAVLTATYQKQSHTIERRHLVLGIVYGTLAMALMALGVIIVKPLLDRSPFLWVTEIRLVGGLLVLAVVLLFHRRRTAILKSVFSAGGRLYTISGSFVGAYLSMVLWIAGMKFTQVSTAAVLNQTNNVFIFVFAAIFLKERVDAQRTIGIILAILGALLVTFGRFY